jgi:hypothetical protein
MARKDIRVTLSKKEEIAFLKKAVFRYLDVCEMQDAMFGIQLYKKLSK